MTFDSVVTEIKDRLGLTSSDATTRVGRLVNQVYREVTAELNIKTSRRTTVTAATTQGVQTIAFSGIEKIDRIIDDSEGSVRVLAERTMDEIRREDPGTGDPAAYAIELMTADSVTVRLDVLPQDVRTLKADGLAEAATLSGSDEPAFPASFHDLLIEAVVAKELLKAEKIRLSQESAAIARRRLSSLRLHIMSSQGLSLRQGMNDTTAGSTVGSSGGGSSQGGLSYTQTGLITFDRDPSAPFAVTASSAVVTNLDADKLDGQEGSYYRDAGNLNAGTIPLARISGLTNTEVAAGAAIAWSKLDKTGSSLADLATRSAADLSSGTLPDGRFPATLPAASGVNLTALNATQLTSGLIPDARVPGLTTDGASKVYGLGFHATQSPSADANTLDDYEEGTWTPTDASGAGLTFGTVEGEYVKVGQLVVATMTVTFPATADTSAIVIGGLPFTIRNSTNNLYPGFAVTTVATTLFAQPLKNTTTIGVFTQAGFAAVNNDTLSTAILRLTIAYRATA